MNQAIMSGYLGADPTMRTTHTGKSVVNFTIAVDRPRRKGETEKQTDWINCVAWENTATQINKYFVKGRPIIVIGAIQTRTWEDKQGQKRKETELLVDRFEFMLPDNKKDESANQEHTNPYHADTTDDDDTALPFDF